MKNRISSIQALRGIAATLVVVFHLCVASYADQIDNVARFGASGVDIFFCISGFVMLAASTRHGTMQLMPFDFLSRRAIRILPFYWLITSCAIALVFAGKSYKFGPAAASHLPQFDVGYLIKSYLLLPVVDPVSHGRYPFLPQGWTLTYEMYFYFILCLIAWRPASPALISLYIAAIMAGPALILRLEEPSWDQTVIANPLLLEFGFGAAIYALVQRYSGYGLPALIIGTALLICTMTIDVDLEDPRRVLFWGVPWALILYGVVTSEKLIHFPSFAARVGDASYSLYLCHYFVAYAYRGFLKHVADFGDLEKLACIAAGTAISILLSLFVYQRVERPILNAITRFYIDTFKEKSAGMNTNPTSPESS